MALDILYFAWVRERVGRESEQISLPEQIGTVSALLGWLAERGGGYAEAFADPSRIRAAVDQVFAQPETSIAGAREVALFPPVTGG